MVSPMNLAIFSKREVAYSFKWSEGSKFLKAKEMFMQYLQ